MKLAQLAACLLAAGAGAWIAPSAPRRLHAARAHVDDVVEALFVESSVVDPAQVAAACAEDVVWDDRCRRKPARGRRAVERMLQSKFRRGGKLVVERVAEAGEGSRLAGFAWRREADDLPGVGGLRGVTLVECDENGDLKSVVESSEPLLKPGKLTADLFAKVCAGLPKITTGTHAPRAVAGCGDLVEYIWREAYPAGAPPAVFAEHCGEGIIYEDLNYREPFLGKPAVEAMVEEYDLGGVEWILTRATTGARSCAFTWQIKLKGEVAADGVSFYDGYPVQYIRDIPSPLVKPAPLQFLAARLRPKLRVFRGRRAHWCYGDSEEGRPLELACDVSYN